MDLELLAPGLCTSMNIIVNLEQYEEDLESHNNARRTRSSIGPPPELPQKSEEARPEEKE